MLLLILVLTSVASAGKFPCEESRTDPRRPSKCPPGQVLHRNVCRSYFHLRSDKKLCLLPESLFNGPAVPSNEVICPLREKTSLCYMYFSYHEQCFSFAFPSQRNISCKGYNAQQAYRSLEICAKLTDGIPHTGFLPNGGRPSVRYFTAIIPPSRGGQCPSGYCPTNRGKCILSGKKYINSAVYSGGALEPLEIGTTFTHGSNADATHAANFRIRLEDWHRIGG